MLVDKAVRSQIKSNIHKARKKEHQYTKYKKQIEIKATEMRFPQMAPEHKTKEWNIHKETTNE